MTVSRFTLADERLQALSERFPLDSGQRERLSAVVRELASDPHSPTAVRDPAQAVELHVADSLSALELPQVRAARRIADIGSGAGFPGLPIAIVLPQSRVSLVESQARRCAFLERVCRVAAAKNAAVVCARVEEWSEGLGACDLVVARALAPQPIVLEYAAPLLVDGGLLVDWRGGLDATTTTASAHAAQELGLELAEVRKVEPFAGANRRHLYLYLKVRATPERFPRRAGSARKHPLGGK